MSLFNAIFNGTPSSTPAPAATVLGGVDTNTGALWLNTPESAAWVPVSSSSARGASLGVTSATGTVLTFTAPATGLYNISAYAVQATSTSGTLPALTATWTEGDTGTSESAKTIFADNDASDAEGTYSQGSLIVNAEVGTTITVSWASLATLTANIKARIAFLG